MLTKGIVEIDKMLRLKKGEREMICTLAQAMSYSYEVSGTKNPKMQQNPESSLIIISVHFSQQIKCCSKVKLL